ncbi:hypothetical protein PHMEG_0005588 [Phytophthora megakarya]|uniref:Uncharacterized protein n=1 Tax=Phytophthora megakarya TaxID=4795 RepID=A0A225WR57_9STRA|nr:hypothetical protein PHMEG_0005588 [Phytophthora megakarya]
MVEEVLKNNHYSLDGRALRYHFLPSETGLFCTQTWRDTCGPFTTVVQVKVDQKSAGVPQRTYRLNDRFWSFRWTLRYPYRNLGVVTQYSYRYVMDKAMADAPALRVAQALRSVCTGDSAHPLSSDMTETHDS